MHLIFRLFAAIIVNLLAVLAADFFLEGFIIEHTTVGVGSVTMLLTIISIVALPIAKFLLKPFIILTLGLLSFALNALALYALDFLAVSLTIQTLGSLLAATVIITIVNTLARPLVHASW